MANEIETQPEAQTEIGRGLFAIAAALNRLGDLLIDEHGEIRIHVDASLSGDDLNPLPLHVKQDDE